MSSSNRPVHIVTDSTADLPSEWITDLPVTVVPLSVEIEGETFLDGVNLSRDEFVRRLRGGALPRTSQPSIGAFQEVYQRLLDEGNEIVSIHIAPQLSGTYNSALQARSMVDSDSIHVLDSTSFTLGIGFLILEASELIQQGKSASEIAAFVEERAADIRMFATLETLEYLRKGGRIGRASAMLGSALQLKPIIRITNGAVEPVERVRTYRKALQRLFEIYTEHQPFDRIAILHLDAQEEADKLNARVREVSPELDIVSGQVGTVIGTYAGPGLVGFVGLVSRKR
jgi:DegV family protein with EDD domain